MDFREWIDRWMALARFRGKDVPEPESRIGQALVLWREHIDPGWERQLDRRLLDPTRRYCRRNWLEDSVRRGEHVIEYEVLAPDPDVDPTTSLGLTLVDGVNAVPLTTNPGAGRRKNVEADMLLLVRNGRGEHVLQLVEVKTAANNTWYAVLENLCQMKFFSQAPNTPSVFHKRHPTLGLPERLPAIPVVLAGSSWYYEAQGQKGRSLPPARMLVEEMRAQSGVHVELAIWHAADRVIAPL